MCTGPAHDQHKIPVSGERAAALDSQVKVELEGRRHKPVRMWRMREDKSHKIGEAGKQMDKWQPSQQENIKDP